MPKSVNALAAVAVACVLLTGVAAAETREPVHAVVRYSDLNLSTPQGLAHLQARVRSAIQAACGGTSPDLASTRDSRRCIGEMTRDSQVRLADLRRDGDRQLANLDLRASLVR